MGGYASSGAGYPVRYNWGICPLIIMQTSTDNKTLYDRDFNLWISQQVALLKAGEVNAIDLENLAEEIDSMGKRDKRALASFLLRLLEHLLKINYWHSEKERNYKGWKKEVRNFRLEIQAILNDSPSLKNYLPEIFGKKWNDALKNVSDDFKVPEDAKITLEQALDENFFAHN